jgi:hypothetical protein
MLVRFRNPELNMLSWDEAAFVSSQQMFLLPDNDYVVHAVSVFDKVVFVQIVDDKDTPVFLPRALFELVSADIPNDWICNIFSDGPLQLVLGPVYVAKDVDSYNAMIDQEFGQVEKLWRRVESDKDSDP